MPPHFSELRAWQRAHELVLSVYGLTAGFPSDEFFGLASQLRRAVIAMATHIAEGTRRGDTADVVRFLDDADRAAAEAEYLLMLSRDLGYLMRDQTEPLLTDVLEVSRMLGELRTGGHGGAGPPS